MLGHEINGRHNNYINKLIKNAKFRYSKARVDDIDYNSKRLSPDSILPLLECEWIDRHRSTIIMGATGTGKTWLACVLGNYACRKLRKVMFVQAADLYEDIILSIADGSIAKVKQK